MLMNVLNCLFDKLIGIFHRHLKFDSHGIIVDLSEGCLDPGTLNAKVSKSYYQTLSVSLFYVENVSRL
jgi:hypothetical protein